MDDNAAALVLVHGAWHGAWSWDRVVPLLTDAGIDVVTVDLPGHGSDAGPLEDLPGDTARVMSALDALDRPVVLVGHSYGGAVITGAGVHPSVVHLVFIAAFPLDTGESCATAAADDAAAAGVPQPERSLADEFVIGDDGMVTLTTEGIALLYSDCDEATVAAATAQLTPQPLVTFTQPPLAVAWREKPSTYVLCSRDEGVLPELQEVLAHRCGEVVRWDTGHSPFASQPELVASYLTAAARAATTESSA